MHLQKLSLVNYKNISSELFDFDVKINCFIGNNGVGKTNVLDAIYYLSYTKSYFNAVATQNIKHGEEFFMVEGDYLMEDERVEKIVCSLKKGTKKIVKRNGKAYEKFSDHIGSFPLVMISPSDRDLILEGSETRRKFMDGVISQQDRNYLQKLLNYGKVLTQRNALLKYFAANRTFDALNLSVYNEQLDDLSQYIYEKRVWFLKEFAPIFNQCYQEISNSKEEVQLLYKTQLDEKPLLALFEEHLAKDRVLQYTSVGIHKDDLQFELNQYPIKKFGSQGQQKSYLIALKLAQFEFMKQLTGKKPILLFDDIFDKLDENRVTQVINLVNKDHFGQIFISDTHGERTENVVKKTQQTYKIFHL
ncbi:DNA replication/repair protein RecF [Wenyingzhuangia sp. 2_MG-2023]|uniref:DNA replication/repair protein RecF n=1 Tax=Wenyingzhuangia sp. 2_MG-2023 TaxID=3062639 RepID=UPI0026E1A563|nr:DNA replication and repair protein RecF [Wenyingzhuangia sp. 2_MG-2023]MDO6738301.1 DNA replication and repair protein RecF [Wenyingzhuangia sp. 2_MG-2023]MDO6802215.1 DNA replication and repair protein RecF [Wenyingzhuangia sp. 1_MG-2023]